MDRTFSLLDSLALGDLHVFLGRAQRVRDGAVRLIADSGVLAVYIAVLHPIGLLDESPTVLGLRTFAVDRDDSFDVVVPVASLLARVESRLEPATAEVGEPVTVTLPTEVATVTWTAISPPRGRWQQLGSAQTALLEAAARDGIQAVASMVPDAVGELAVQRVRTEVWGREMEGVEHLPAGAAFAALALGFLGEEESAIVYESGSWLRLTTRRGHVLVKRRGWSLAR